MGNGARAGEVGGGNGTCTGKYGSMLGVGRRPERDCSEGVIDDPKEVEVSESAGEVSPSAGEVSPSVGGVNAGVKVVDDNGAGDVSGGDVSVVLGVN
jgi:hypothetical protein